MEETALNPKLLVPIAAAAVILLGIVIGVVTMMMAKAKRAMVEKWGHAAYSLWTGGEDCATWQEQRARSALGDWYGATNYQAYLEVIEGLRHGQTGNPAWDKVRALDLLRIGRAAAFLDDDQCRTRIAEIGRELQQQFKSWEELGQAFEQGMQAWQRSRGVSDPAQLGRVQNNLPKLRSQIWPGVRFDTELVADD